RVRGNDRAFTDLGPRHDQHAGADPGMVVDHDRLDVFRIGRATEAAALGVHRMAAGIAEGHAAGNLDVAAYPDLAADHEAGLVRDVGVVADLQSWPAGEAGGVADRDQAAEADVVADDQLAAALDPGHVDAGGDAPAHARAVGLEQRLGHQHPA